MKIIGWIRMGDKAACGGTVVEGLSNVIIRGRPTAYTGARMACRKNCVILQGQENTTLPNGRHPPHHGHLTSGGCPLVSTLNDIHGWGNEGGEEIYPAFAPDGEGDWRGIYPPEREHSEARDEYFIVLDEKDGTPARNRYYRIVLETGETIEGQTDEEGRTRYAASDKRVALTLELGPQHEIHIG